MTSFSSAKGQTFSPASNRDNSHPISHDDASLFRTIISSGAGQCGASLR
jgi:hypothetical protein